MEIFKIRTYDYRLLDAIRLTQLLFFKKTVEYHTGFCGKKSHKRLLKVLHQLEVVVV